MSSNKEFGEWLKKRREEAGFNTAYKFAEEVGFDKTYIGRIENGDRAPTANFCIAIAPVLGLTKDYVLNLAGLAESEPRSTRNFIDVEETQTILDTFPSAESRRRAVQIANNLLRQLAQNEREGAGAIKDSTGATKGSAGQTGGVHDAAPRKGARRRTATS